MNAANPAIGPHVLPCNRCSCFGLVNINPNSDDVIWPFLTLYEQKEKPMLTEEEIIAKAFPGLQSQCFDMMQNEDGEIIALYIRQREDEKPLAIDHPGRMAVRFFTENAGLPFFIVQRIRNIVFVKADNEKAREILPVPMPMDKDIWEDFIDSCADSFDYYRE